MISKRFSTVEIAKHTKAADLWIVIDAKVFDLSGFAAVHPGGLSVLLEKDVAGQDATELFFSLHRHEILQRPQYARLQIGLVQGKEPIIVPRSPGGLTKVPYAEPTWLSKGYFSPYYKDHHRKLQAAVRKFIDEVVYPDAQAREADGKRPTQSVFDEMGRLNIIAAKIGPGKHLQGRELMGGVVKPEEFDNFHELIIFQEFGRLSAKGYEHGLGGGTDIGLPLVIHFAKPAVRDRIVPELLSGKKHICLAISEAFAGSDVSGMKCFAQKTRDGEYWIVNGTKKWITNASFADYFTVGCRTADGTVVLLVERGPGVETTPIKTAYSAAAGTAFVTLDDVRVPYAHTLGPESGGLQVILSNFNHERWAMACSSVSAQRVVVEECLLWCAQRKVFGKALSEQAVIRSKLAAMISRVESAQNWLENVTYQMVHMNYKQQSANLAGQIGFLKMYCTKTGQLTAEDSTQIFGGRSTTRTGMGRVIEHYHSTITLDAVLGGAEDVIADLGVRQALRKMPKDARI